MWEVVIKKKISIIMTKLFGGGIFVSVLQSLASLFAAGVMMVNTTLMTAAPQNDPEHYLLLVNRQWRMSSDYVPPLRQANVQGQVRRLRPEVATALENMYRACKEETGATLVSVSGYREYAKQERIYKAKLKRVRGDTKAANAFVALPGTSEHQTGLTMDVGQKSLSSDENLSGTFGGSRGGKWLKENCWRFGFIIRYQEGWEQITGYSPEPWHVRYVGSEHAKRIHEKEMPLEEYLKLVRVSEMIRLLEE